MKADDINCICYIDNKLYINKNICEGKMHFYLQLIDNYIICEGFSNDIIYYINIENIDKLYRNSIIFNNGHSLRVKDKLFEIQNKIRKLKLTILLNEL